MSLIVAIGWVAAVLAVAALVWGWFEAGWVRFRTLEVDVPGLRAELDGLRIVHLSDFHLGLPSRGGRAVEQAVAWARRRDPDLVCITGDLVSRPRGEDRLRALLRDLHRCYAILGNHDLAISRDPFSKSVELDALEPAELLLDEGRRVEVHGEDIWIAGLDPRSRGREPRLHEDAALTILLSHFPNVLDRRAAEGFDVVLAGHMHDGQICVPYPGGKLRLAHPSAPYTHGIYRRNETVMHVSSGLGTTFVPFRFCARPEGTELVLRAAPTIET